MLDLSIYFDRSPGIQHLSVCPSWYFYQLSIMTPRNLCCLTVLIISLSVYISIWSSRQRFCRDANYICCFLSDLHQQKKPVAPHCSLNSTTFSSLFATCIVESSAYRSTSVPFVNKGTPFIKSRNNTGPKTEPWGNPDFTVWNSKSECS